MCRPDEFSVDGQDVVNSSVFDQTERGGSGRQTGKANVHRRDGCCRSTVNHR